MNEDPFKDQKIPNQERIVTRITIATPDDWEAYKTLKLQGASENVSSSSFVSKEELNDILEFENDFRKSEKEWKNELLRNDRFVVLAWDGSRAIGMGCAREVRKGIWYMSFGFVTPEQRRKGIGKKIFAKRLNEIRSRRGEVVALEAEIGNDASVGLAESFGFKKVEGISKKIYMELENVNAPEVVKKINEVLDAR